MGKLKDILMKRNTVEMNNYLWLGLAYFIVMGIYHCIFE